MRLLPIYQYRTFAKFCLTNGPRPVRRLQPVVSPSRTFTSKPGRPTTTFARPLLRQQRNTPWFTRNDFDGARDFRNPKKAKIALKWDSSSQEADRLRNILSPYKFWKKRKNIIMSLDKANTKRPPYARDEAVSPSEKSGGVPDPTAEYLQQASLPSRRRADAQPLLVIIDLNGTLLHRPDIRHSPKKFVKRPYAALFLNYCIKTFWVVVWTSARPENANVMCKNLATPDKMKGIVAIWARDRFGLTPEDYMKRVQCYKRLSSLWVDPEVARSHPNYNEGGRWSQANTVLIDDSSEKARSEPFNVIVIPEFMDVGDKHEGILPVVHDYLNELCFASDASAYMRSNPFRPPSDLEIIGTPPTSLCFYDAKQNQRDKKRDKRAYVYPVTPSKKM